MPTGDPWQNVDRLRRQWLADFDRDPLDGLDAENVRTLRLALSLRHLIERNAGVIDERFRRETGEGSIGRRIRIAPAFVDRVDDAVAPDRDEAIVLSPLASPSSATDSCDLGLAGMRS